tara:strand:- start:31 stop:477 length:447 start_codon:yes stop_codon:yes gene_type:complete
MTRSRNNSEKESYPNTRKSWKKEEVAELIELHNGGLSAEDIAYHLGRTTKAVHERMYVVRSMVNGKPKPKPKLYTSTPDDWDAIRNMGKPASTPSSTAPQINPVDLSLSLKPSPKEETHWQINKTITLAGLITISVGILAYIAGFTSQ